MVQTKFLTLFFAACITFGQSLEGVVDVHAHADPDVVPRSIDWLSLAKLAKNKGLKAIVFKSHYEPTASMAYIVQQQVPGIRIFGGLALNKPVGGVNPAAVEHVTKVKERLTKIVWMPTFDAPAIPIAKNGKLLPETLAVLDIIAKHNLVLATGHSKPEDSLLLLREAKSRGIKHTIVTHPSLPLVNMSVTQMKQAASLGAYLEFVGNAVIGKATVLTMKEYADTLKSVGYEHCILSSDFGQEGNPIHPDGLEQLFRGLLEAGVPASAIEMMSKTNPSRLLGID